MKPSLIAGTILAAAALAACGNDQPAASGASGAAAPAANAGERAFSPCAVCHVVADPASAAGQVRLVGPNLHGVFGGPAASVEGFVYSEALQNAGIVWDEATLDAFIENPQAVVPRNRMAFAGVPDAERRAAIVEYLKAAQ